MILEKNKKVYFASDLHLGMHPRDKSLVREKEFVQWLNEKKNDAAAIFLLGDVFDYWWEYKKVVPRGFTRFLGKIAEITDAGIPVHVFTGNHDVWIFDYLPQETGVQVHKKPFKTEIGGKKFYIAHGDGLGPGDIGYKLLKWAFYNRFLQWCYARFHPNFSVSLAHLWSKKSRYAKGFTEEFKGEEKEILLHYSRDILNKEHFDYFIYGHRHLVLDIPIQDNSRYINVGDWVSLFSWAEFNGEDVSLCFWEKKQIIP